jgi:hypothetical protein
MTDRDPRCVHVDPDAAMARFVASWLTAQGLPAKVTNEEILGGFEGLVSVSAGLGSHGVEVWVDDPADADGARQLLAEKEAELKAAHSAKASPIEAVCDECGTRSTFPGEARGSVQECPNCAVYMDIPGADDDWDDADIEATAEGE